MPSTLVHWLLLVTSTATSTTAAKPLIEYPCPLLARLLPMWPWLLPTSTRLFGNEVKVEEMPAISPSMVVESLPLLPGPLNLETSWESVHRL